MGEKDYSSGGPFSRANTPFLFVIIVIVFLVSWFYWFDLWGKWSYSSKVVFNPGDIVIVPCGNGVLLENGIGNYMLVRIDNGVGAVPRYSEVRFFKWEISKANAESR
jgi:hypothetical protein